MKGKLSKINIKHFDRNKCIMEFKKEKKLKDTSMALIQHKLQLNMLNCIYDILNTLENDKNSEINSNIIQIKQSMYKIFTSINEYLKTPLNERKETIKELNNLISNLINNSFSSYINFYYLNNSMLYIINEYKLIQVEKNEKFNLNFSLIQNDCINFISTEKDEFIKKFMAGIIISKFPLRMTKDKYYEYIKLSFNDMFKNLPINFLNGSVKLLEYKFCPENFINEDDIYYSSIYNKIKEINNINLKDISESEINNILDELEEYKNLISLNIEYMSVLFNILNYLLNIISYAYDSEYIFEDDFVFKDMYFSVCDIINNKNNDYIKESVIKNINKKIELIYEKIEPLTEIYNKILNDFDFENIDENTIICISTHNIIENNFRKELSNEIQNINSDNNENIADKKLIDNMADNFISYIKNVCENKDNLKVKFNKQIFLENIPYPFSKKDFFEYLNYVFKSSENTNQIYVAVSDLYILFEQYGFNPSHLHDNCECGHHHNHHHH